MGYRRDIDPGEREREIRQLVGEAHERVRMAQDLAYSSDRDGKVARLRTRLALNAAQNRLIKMLVRSDGCR